MALAQGMLRTGRGVNGSAFLVEGMSSAADPMFISDRSYRAAMNTLNRGGVLRTRPGYRQVFELPEGKLQGMAYFRTFAGTSYLVVAVSGTLYASQYPFQSYDPIPGISLYEHAPKVFFTTAVRSARRNPDGTITAIDPQRVLVMQDGAFTAPVWFDGTGGGRLDPADGGTPLGGPMKWSGDRLWVGRDNLLFAGDISNPFSFEENEYLAEGGFFQFPERIVALEELPSSESPVLLVFCENSVHAIKSGVRTRANWKSTENFQAPLFPVGCVSHRSVVAQYGQLWWMTPQGLTNLDAAKQAKISSRLAPQDTAMAVSRGNLSGDLSGVALGVYDNFLLCSVPNGDRLNTHTWVLDGAVVSETEKDSSTAWAGVWTGTRPVEWASGVFDGRRRIFQASVDYDGVNRLWEAFRPELKDNGSDIRCFVETKTHIDFSEKATGLDLKKFIFGEASFTDVVGDVPVTIYWAATRGKYKKLGEWLLKSDEGSVSASAELGDMESYRSQGRIIRTPEAKLDASVANIESSRLPNVDVGFSLLIVWQGRAALRSYRLFCDPFQESSSGKAAITETGVRSVSGVLEA